VSTAGVDINVDGQTNESGQAGIGGGEMGMGTGAGIRWAIPGFVDIPYSCLQNLKEVMPTTVLTVLRL
jgi:hypothetical protein